MGISLFKINITYMLVKTTLFSWGDLKNWVQLLNTFFEGKFVLKNNKDENEEVSLNFLKLGGNYNFRIKIWGQSLIIPNKYGGRSF